VELEGHQFEPIKDPMKELYRIQSKITNKMYELDQLNWQYYDKQEKLFLKTFINIMDRMSNELQIYK
jgi:ferritin